MNGCRPPAYTGPSLRHGKIERKLEAEPSVRVAVARDRKQTDMGCAGPCEVWAGPPGRALYEAKDLSLELSVTEAGFTVNGRPVEGEWLAVRPRQGIPLRLNDKEYPGEMHVTRQGAGLTVVNVLPAERYLGGVVAKEMRPSWPAEALKAQAVAARSYAMYQIRLRQDKPYDVVATSRSQRYLGASLDQRVDDAVAATRGLVLAHDGRVVPGFYHSTCGGHTANAAKVFAMKHLDFLQGVPCEFCERSPYATWTIEVTNEELAEALSKPGRPVSKVTALQVLGRGEDGRFDKIRVFTGADQFDVKALHFRYALGTYRLKSARFQLETAPVGFLIRGEGFGHGVGMCQYGARGMAERSASFRQILAKYYAKTELAALYD